MPGFVDNAHAATAQLVDDLVTGDSRPAIGGNSRRRGWGRCEDGWQWRPVGGADAGPAVRRARRQRLVKCELRLQARAVFPEARDVLAQLRRFAQLLAQGDLVEDQLQHSVGVALE